MSAQRANLLSFVSPEPPIGTRVARYGYVYERTDAGWRKVGLMVKTNVPKIWPKRRGRAIAWADLFSIDGGSDFVVALNAP